MNHPATALVLALAIGAVAFTTSQAKISRAPRLWLARRKSRSGTWLFDLVSCPFCTAVWLSLAATAIYRPLLVRLWWPLDYLTTSFAIAAASMLAVAVIRHAIR